MKPAAMRNLNWAEVQAHVSDDLRRVHAAWQKFGPGTTRAVAERSGISLLTLRPRTTDLYQLGLVDCIGQAEGRKESVFEYVAPETAALGWERKRKALPVAASRRGASNAPRHRPGTLAWAASIMARARVTKGARGVDTAQLALL